MNLSEVFRILNFFLTFFFKNNEIGKRKKLSSTPYPLENRQKMQNGSTLSLIHMQNSPFAFLVSQGTTALFQTLTKVAGIPCKKCPSLLSCLSSSGSVVLGMKVGCCARCQPWLPHDGLPLGRRGLDSRYLAKSHRWQEQDGSVI